jgi:D-amino peptidase
MEGMSGITDHRECWPAFAQYWQAGRRAFADEVTAAATGLLDGGATRVFVVNAHGLGWPNVLWGELPANVGPADDAAWADGFDVAFQVGFHARAGTTGAFMSHTMVPGLKVSVDGALITECHIWAWLDGLPLIGVAGEAGLAAQMDGIVRDVPFLTVKYSTNRAAAAPVHAARSDRLAAITEFALEQAASPPAPLELPGRFTLAVALDPSLADAAEGQHGLTRTSPEVLTLVAEDWAGEAQPALEAAMGAALQPFFAAQGDLDLSSEASMGQQDQAQLDRFRRFFDDWAADDEPAWPT